MHACMDVYICRERERASERARERESERARERERETERESAYGNTSTPIIHVQRHCMKH
jgi:hypothetical protein